VIYPEENWVQGLFRSAPKTTWDDPELTKQFLEAIGQRLSIKAPEDWYRVSVAQVGNQNSALGSQFLSLKKSREMLYYQNLENFMTPSLLRSPIHNGMLIRFKQR
jgi:hypothetical protein